MWLHLCYVASSLTVLLNFVFPKMDAEVVRTSRKHIVRDSGTNGKTQQQISMSQGMSTFCLKKILTLGLSLTSLFISFRDTEH